MLAELIRRLLMAFRRRKFDIELDEEMRLHRELREQELTERGVSAEEAHYAAHRRFGIDLLLREESRDMWGWNSFETLWQDVRYGLRQLRLSPGFTAAAVITLALGIGANTAIFSVVNGILIRPLPYQDPSHLIVLWQRVPHFGANAFATPDFLAWRKQKVMAIAASTEEGFNLGVGARPEHVAGSSVSWNFFALLGVRPSVGRTFLPEEDLPNSPRVAILSYGLWQRDFGGDASVVGKTVRLNGEAYSVIGVLPASFRSDLQPDAELWTPLESDPTFAATRASHGVHWLLVIGRLNPDVSLNQARAAMGAIAESLGKAYPDTDARLGVDLNPLGDFVGGSIRPALLILFAAVACVLLIACANVANMLLARATVRARELAVRIAIGAGRVRLIRQLLTESIFLALLGGALGVFLAYCGLHLVRVLNPGNIPRPETIGIDSGVLLFTLALCMGTGIFFGIVPALHAARTDLNTTLKEGRLSVSSGSGQSKFRRLLVASEVAVALVLVVGAGLMLRSLYSLEEASLGFNPHNLLAMQLTFDQSAHSPQETVSFYQQVLDGVKSLPGIESAAIARDLPLAGANPSSPFNMASHPVASLEQRPIARYRAVSSGYFHTLEMPLLSGRDFTDRDNRGSSGVVIINQEMARQFWPQQNPIGEQIAPARGAAGWCTIVGIVGDDRKNGAEFPVYPTMYYPYLQVPDPDVRLIEGSMRLVIRSRLVPSTLVGAVKQAVEAVNKETPVYDVRTMDEIVSASMAGREFNTALLGIFALLALAIALAGVYAVMSYAVSRQTHEFGIRMALGAGRGDVLKLVLRQGMIIAAIGGSVGLAGALGLTRFMASLLYGVKPTDIVTFAAAAVVVGVALLASYLPARRATKVDPLVALRYE